MIAHIVKMQHWAALAVYLTFWRPAADVDRPPATAPAGSAVAPAVAPAAVRVAGRVP